MDMHDWSRWMLAGLVSLGLTASSTWAQDEESAKDETAAKASDSKSEADKSAEPKKEGSADPALTPDDASQKYPEIKDAIDLLRQMKFDDCLNKLQEAEKLYPELPVGRLIYAELLVKANQILVARQEFEKAVRERPEDPRPYMSMGAMGLAEGRLTDALLEFNHALSLAETYDFKTPEALSDFKKKLYVGRSAAYEKLEDWKNALADIQAWLEVDPTNGLARQRGARCHFNLGDIEKAEAELAQAKKDTPTLSPPETALASFYAAKKEDEKAEDLFKKGVVADKSNPVVYHSFAQWLYGKSRAREAKDQVILGLQTLPDSKDLRMLRAMLARHLKSYEEAEVELDDLLREQPNNLQLRNELALSLAEQQDDNKKKRAFEIAAQNVQANKNSPDFIATFGWVNYRLGQMEKAEQFISAAAKMAGTQARPELLYYLAHVLAEQGKNDDVKKLLTQIVSSEFPFAFKDDAAQWLDRLQSN
jgi:predicted Zn-dependent protease